MLGLIAFALFAVCYVVFTFFNVRWEFYKTWRDERKEKLSFSERLRLHDEPFEKRFFSFRRFHAMHPWLTK